MPHTSKGIKRSLIVLLITGLPAAALSASKLEGTGKGIMKTKLGLQGCSDVKRKYKNVELDMGDTGIHYQWIMTDYNKFSWNGRYRDRKGGKSNRRISMDMGISDNSEGTVSQEVSKRCKTGMGIVTKSKIKKLEARTNKRNKRIKIKLESKGKFLDGTSIEAKNYNYEAEAEFRFTPR